MELDSIVHAIDFGTFDAELSRCLEGRWTTAPRRVQAPTDDAASVVSDATSVVSLRCTEHATMRMRERRLSLRTLQRTLCYGQRSPTRSGRLRIHGNGVAMIRDRANTRTITAFQTYRAPRLPTLWDAIRPHLRRRRRRSDESGRE